MIFGYIWLTLGIFLLIVEVFTADFLFGSVGIACLIAGASAFLGLDVVLQVIIFSISLVLIFAFLRPFVKNFIQGENHAKELGLNTLVEKKGIVTEAIINAEDKGRVKIDGDIWRAISDNDEVIAEGTRVQVVKSEGITVYVVKVGE